MTVRAIETSYQGCRFRSRLEARWAVFLDALGVPWEYEKQGYNLDGLCYLPDFWLPRQRQWMEVKGERNHDGWLAAYLLAKETRCFVCIMHGEFRPWSLADAEGDSGAGYGWYGDDRHTWPSDPDPVYWGRCPACGLYGVGHFGHHGLCACRNNPPGGDYGDPAFIDQQWDWANPDRHVSIINAYRAARSARFEHGEACGAPAPDRPYPSPYRPPVRWCVNCQAEGEYEPCEEALSRGGRRTFDRCLRCGDEHGTTGLEWPR